MNTAEHMKLLNLSLKNDINKFESLVSSLQQVTWSDVCHIKSGDTVMHVAARNGSVDILRFLKANTNCDFEQMNFDGKRPLHEAAQAGQLASVKYLISQKTFIDPLKRADWTPLMLACTKAANLPVVEELLEAGANPKIINKDGWNAFHIACREGDESVVRFLLTRCPDIWTTTSKNKRRPIHTAAMHGHTKIVDILLQVSTQTLNDADSCGSTPFMDASRFNHLDTMKLLHEKYHADVSELDVLGQTCLHLAAQANALIAIKYLVNVIGISVDLKTSSGQTSLHLAAKEGHCETIVLLLELRAKLDIKDNNNRSPACIAGALGFQKCYELLKVNNE